MPWQRSGDNAATYPKLMQTAADKRADDRTVNEVAGWLWRCSTQSAGHMTDYVIDLGTARMIGGARTDELVRLCTRTGLITQETVDGMKQLRLIADPEFIHIRLRREVEWERQQRSDTRDPRLKVPILARDGDCCRRCGVVVQWRGRTSSRKGTLGHQSPGEPGTVETMNVECWGCNSSRKDDPSWDEEHPLRPAPAHPLYGAVTAAFLTENGRPTQPNNGERPGADTAEPTRTSASSPRPAPAPAHPARKAPENVEGIAQESHSNDIPTPPSTPTERVLSGRDGSGVGLVGEGERTRGSQPGRRKRGRRGGRGSGTGAGTKTTPGSGDGA